jgi:hypothetical protein
MDFRLPILDFRFLIPQIENQESKIKNILRLASCALLCISTYFGSSSAFAEHKVDDEVSTNDLAARFTLDNLPACSTLPYLKRLGCECIQPGTLHLYLSTQDARVYLDGKPFDDLERDGVKVVQQKAGKRPFLAFENLIPGTHTLLVTKRSHRTSLKYVSVEPGSTKSVTVKLRSRWRFLVAETFILASLAGIGYAAYILVSGSE